MKLNYIFRKLHKQNKGQNRILGFCIFLSVLLVTSFSLMYYGPTVQNFLAQGGDTRKMANLLLGITAVGCLIFTIYASGLFFRYKSREYGIFLALGESKKTLKKVLFGELASITAIAAVLGLLAAIPASFLIWKLFETFLVSTREMKYQFGFDGFIVGIAFAMILCLFLGISGQKFVKRTDIMEILRTQHKTEMVKEIKPWTFTVGIVFIFVGIFGGLALPSIAAYVFHHMLPGITNLFFLFSLAGIYLVLLNIVAQNRLGKKKEKFYKNMVSISMMRFFAKSATRNMCVIVLLLFSCIFAGYYGALYADGSALFDLANSKGFALHYPAPEKQITKEEIQRTADSYGVKIKEFGEADACNFLISYKCRDLNDDMQYITVDNTQSKYALFFSEDSYECLTGRRADVPSGTYKTVTSTDYKENIWDFTDGLWEASNPDTGRSISLTNSGTLEYDALSAMSDPYAYVLNDRDYAELSEGLTEIHKEHLVLFDVEDLSASYPFAYDLMCQYVEHATDLSNHLGLYDVQEEKIATEQGREYALAGKIDMSMDNALLLGDWKYAPAFVVVTNEMFMQTFCVYIMLCLYIAIITLTAAAIMSYVRSISIASDNRTLFENLSKLGAGKAYQRNILAKQLVKIFQYPAVLGCLIGFLFSAAMSWFNDGRYTVTELKTLGLLLGLALFIIMFLYGVYRVALQKGEQIVGIRKSCEKYF